MCLSVGTGERLDHVEGIQLFQPPSPRCAGQFHGQSRLGGHAAVVSLQRRSSLFSARPFHSCGALGLDRNAVAVSIPVILQPVFAGASLESSDREVAFEAACVRVTDVRLAMGSGTW